jgi:DNA helicase-2/ATP-dependent DNA helicase PcrA
MRRACRLLEEGVDPRRVMAATFTRTSATDLKKALRALGVDGADSIRAVTLHGYSFGLLKRDDVFGWTQRHPRALLDFEQRFLLEDLVDPRFGGIRLKEERLHAFFADWARLQSEVPGWPDDPVDQAFHQALLAWLRFHRAMLIGELISLASAYLRNNPLTEFDHVLVDEYQDLNRAEQQLVDLVAAGAALAVVGDEDQSIYAFRNAHPEGMQDFRNTHPGTRDIELLVPTVPTQYCGHGELADRAKSISRSTAISFTGRQPARRSSNRAMAGCGKRSSRTCSIYCGASRRWNGERR